MRESQGQNRRGTPTGERALQGARLPQGKQVDPRLSAFCFLFIFRPFVLSCAVPDLEPFG